MKAKLKETGAALAGEMSGHIFFNDRWFGFDDALYSAARLIEILSKDTRTSAEIFAQFPDSINTPELNIELEEGENFIFMDSMFAEANFTEGKITAIDGMRIDFSNGWGGGWCVHQIQPHHWLFALRLTPKKRCLPFRINSDS